MNQLSTPTTEHEQLIAGDTAVNEIPSFPGAEQEQYIPQGVEVSSPQTERYIPVFTPTVEKQKAPEKVDLYNTPENRSIPQSKTPELQTNITYETSRSGERIFVNPELGQTTFKGGVTTQQLVSKVAGYYTVQQGLVSDPKSGLLQQTATSGDPASASTWQASILYKILQAFWNVLGITV